MILKTNACRHRNINLEVLNMKKIQRNASLAVLSDSDRLSLTEAYANSPLSTGKASYLSFLGGASLTHKERCEAKCFECCNGYLDGKRDCRIPNCPLYPVMPYRGVELSE